MCVLAARARGPISAAQTARSNPLAAYGIRAIDLGGRHPSQLFTELVPGARVVKAFNHLEADLLSQAPAGGGQRALFYSGDDADAKAEVRGIIEQTGNFPVDLGTLAVGAPFTSPPFGAFSGVNLVKLP